MLAEQNYQVWDRELLAVMTSLDEWRHFLMGARHPFEIHSDHKNLTYFRQPQWLNPRQAQWVVELQNYDFTLIQSRRVDHETKETEGEDVVVLKEEWFRVLVDRSE
ncbi:hypothetical protein BN946_scf184859.g1 [Trametes cinnabarina]|uniref:Reverse transcriptase RNase H-like domain-containing protein n=1 Tax=Pycnoporus cinnabarinus TaxID=5643 RepID=A0A060SJD9_PYCCI|nr:hypothetical protein BN946_scf184859.g1 [Trametes cinnabarina]